METPEALDLSIPAKPEYVGTVRLFVSSLGSHYGLEDETVADLKVAISEACNGVIEWAKSGDAHIDVVVVPGGPGGRDLAFQVRSEQGSSLKQEDRWDPSTPADGFQGVLGRGLIDSLFPGARYIEEEGGGLTVTFSVPSKVAS